MIRFRALPLVLIFTIVVNVFPVFAEDTPVEEPKGVYSKQDLYKAIEDNYVLFQQVYKHVSLYYVDYIDPEAFIKAGLNGMLATLDPYTEYFEAEDTDDLRIMTTGHYGGVGIRIGLRGQERYLTVISPMPDTPAMRAGIRANDRITHINDESTEGFSTQDAANRMRGEAGTPVKLTIQRGRGEPLEFNITREEIKVNDINYAGILDPKDGYIEEIEPGVGYIRLSRFSKTAGDNLEAAIDTLLKQGMEKLIFDLRGNPGGLLPEAIDVAEKFLPKDASIVSTKGRAPTANREFYSNTGPVLPAYMPLVIMVDAGSASASEIVSGAIQDHDRGVIVGTTTFGKGLVQRVFDMKINNDALKITTAKYYTPSGRLIQKADYFNNNETLIHDDSLNGGEVEDTLFFTDNGRRVVAHGGISPDFEVDYPEIGQATVELWRQGKYFEFIDEYVKDHPKMKSWVITDEIYEDFLKFLEKNEFEFQTDTEREIDNLREIAVEDKFSEEFIAKLDALKEDAKETHAQMLKDENEDIRRRLRLELALVLGGTAERVKASLIDDIQIQEALRVLKDSETYSDALNGQSVEE